MAITWGYLLVVRQFAMENNNFLAKSSTQQGNPPLQPQDAPALGASVDRGPGPRSALELFMGNCPDDRGG
jgi:hypothetical protein